MRSDGGGGNRGPSQGSTDRLGKTPPLSRPRLWEVGQVKPVEPLIFEELPGKGGGFSLNYWDSITVQLRERPGEWARVAEFDDGPNAHWLRTRLADHNRWHPAGHYEWAARTMTDGTGRVYGRWVDS